MKLEISIAIALLCISATLVQAEEKTAIFAGGCFWCIEKDLEHIEGVTSVISGYIGGSAAQATYKEVSRGGTGHYEAVEVHYNPEIVSYKQLLKAFWRGIDPHDSTGQFCDKGSQYRAAIFYNNEAERKLAELSKKALTESGQLKQSIVTQIIEGSKFYPAEEYHQDYYKKSSIRYHFYRNRCGRDNRTKAVWNHVDLDRILK